MASFSLSTVCVCVCVRACACEQTRSGIKPYWLTPALENMKQAGLEGNDKRTSRSSVNPARKKLEEKRDDDSISITFDLQLCIQL